jgi:hypothetical protein
MLHERLADAARKEGFVAPTFSANPASRAAKISRCGALKTPHSPPGICTWGVGPPLGPLFVGSISATRGTQQSV